MTPRPAVETAFERLIRRLTEHTGATPRGRGRQRSALCPAHDDHKPSLSITEGNDRVLVKCQAGCDTDDILNVLGMVRADLFNHARPPREKPQVLAQYEYLDEDGNLLFVVERRIPKDFRQKKPDGKGGWNYKLGDTRRVLYRLPQVIEAVKNGRTVYVVEGEKDVHAIESTGNVATCNPMGAGKWRDDYSHYLKGADVVVIADADEPGRRHAQTVTASLRAAGAHVRLVEPAEGCKDAADHIQAGYTLDQLVETRPELTVIDGGPTAEAPGQHAGIKFVDWTDLFSRPRTPPDWYAKPILAAGRVTLIYSPGKTGKSLLSMEIAAGLATGMPLLGQPRRDPLDVLYIDQEMTEEDWLDRLTDMGYRPGDADDLAAHLHLAQLQNWLPMDTMAGGAMVASVAESVAAKVVIIDTASKVIAGKENDSDTQSAFYRNTVVPLKRAGLAVLILDHTGKDLEKGARGSSAKTDNVDLVYELTKRDENTLVMKRTHMRFHDKSLQGDTFFLRRVTEPDLMHVLEDEHDVANDAITACVKAIRKLAPMQGSSARAVADNLRKHGHGFRDQTIRLAWIQYQIEKGWAS